MKTTSILAIFALVTAPACCCFFLTSLFAHTSCLGEANAVPYTETGCCANTTDESKGAPSDSNCPGACPAADFIIPDAQTVGAGKCPYLQQVTDSKSCPALQAPSPRLKDSYRATVCPAQPLPLEYGISLLVREKKLLL